MARPGKIRLNANRKITALSTEGALDRWNPRAKAATEAPASISIYEVIGEDPWTGGGVTVKRIDAALRSIGNNDVTVNINSPGGDVFEGIAIYNRLREHQGQVNVKVLGLAASAASIIAMAGDTVEIGASSFLMIHNAWVLAVGNRHDMREVADFLEPFDRALADVYVARSGQDLATVQSAMDVETWMSGSQAIEQGYADSLLAADEVVEADSADSGEDVKALRRLERIAAKEVGRSTAVDLVKSAIDQAVKISGMSESSWKPGMSDSADPELASIFAGLLETIRA